MALQLDGTLQLSQIALEEIDANFSLLSANFGKRTAASKPLRRADSENNEPSEEIMNRGHHQNFEFHRKLFMSL